MAPMHARKRSPRACGEFSRHETLRLGRSKLEELRPLGLLLHVFPKTLLKLRNVLLSIHLVALFKVKRTLLHLRAAAIDVPLQFVLDTAHCIA